MRPPNPENPLFYPQERIGIFFPENLIILFSTTSYVTRRLYTVIENKELYGRMQNINPDIIPVIFNTAKKKLNYKAEKEDLDQAFIRYFKENEVTVTMPLVGTSYYDWDPAPKVLEKLTNNLDYADLLGNSEKIRKAKHDFYASLETSVQAEPYNHVDKNSILVCIENIKAKISGNPGLEKAGHIRALAAKVIREAKETKMSYSGKLCRINYTDTVVQMTI